MAKNIWELQAKILNSEVQSEQSSARIAAKEGLLSIEANSGALQPNAKRNGIEQPILAVRLKAKECKITARDGDEFYAGDILDLFNEKFLVMETYIDECEILRGKAYLCNHLFRFQNGKDATIIERYGVIDDGSYSTRDDKQIPTETGSYKIYMPLDDDTDKIFKGKRFAIGTGYNEDLKQTLTVIKVSWIDKKSNNLGDGSHLLVMRAERGEYQEADDSISQSICNFIENDGVEPIEPTTKTRCIISGADELRIGTSREYSVTVEDDDGNDVDITNKEFIWACDAAETVTHSITEDTKRITVSVPKNAILSGETISLSVVDIGKELEAGVKVVEVL